MSAKRTAKDTAEYKDKIERQFNELGHKLAYYANTNWYHAMADIDMARKLYGDEMGHKVIDLILTGMSWDAAVQDCKFATAMGH